MKHFKLASAFVAIAVFTFSCTNTADNNQAPRGANSPPATPVATSTAPATPDAPDELAAARASYQAACVRCHQANGEGGVVEMDDGDKLRVPSFKKGHGLTHTDEQFARKIANGGDGMPAFKGRLSPEQIDGLVNFIRREFQAGLLPEASTGGQQSSH